MNAITRRIFRAAMRVAVVAGVAALAACSLTRPAPVKGTYLLEPAAPAPVARAQAGALRMGVVTVGASFRGRSFVVRETESKYEVDFYHEFLVAPAANIADATARSLTAAKAFAAVIPPGVAADADWVLDAFVAALYADARDAAKPAAVLEVTFYLSRGSGGTGVPLWSRAYKRREVLASTGAAAFVDAQNVALASVLAELARDLSTAQLPAK